MSSPGAGRVTGQRPKRGRSGIPGHWGPRWSSKVGWFLARVVWRTRVLGRANVPATGPVIIAGNHTGVVDGPVLLGVSPRRLHIMVKEEMFRGAVGAILRAAGQIPVDRASRRAALATARAILARGDCVGIFPEGSRGGGGVDEVHGGVAWLALNSAAVVVPAAVLGTRRNGESVSKVPGFRRRLLVEFGNPVRVERLPGESGRAALVRAGEVIRVALADTVAGAAAKHGIALPRD